MTLGYNFDDFQNMEFKDFRKIEDKYRSFEKYPKKHESYYKERKDFMSSTLNKNKFGTSIEKEFKKYWDSFLNRQREAEIEAMKKTMWSRKRRCNEEDTSDSSSSSSSDQEELKDSVGTYFAARKLLKSKYLDYIEQPEAHDDYARYLERFRKSHKDLKGVMKSNAWRDYWKDKMDELFERDCAKTKQRIYEEVKKKPAKKRKRRQTKVKLEPNTKLATRIKAEPTEEKFTIARQTPQLPLFQGIITIKEEPMDDEQQEKIPRSRVEKMLENYDLRVYHVTENIREAFDGYLMNHKTYPSIDDEKKAFLKRQKTSGSYAEDDVLQFEENFLDFWPERVKVLREEQIKKEMRRIRAGWVDLVPDPSEVAYDDESSTGRLSGLDESSGTKETSTIATQTEFGAEDSDDESEETLKIYDGTE